MSSKTIHKFEFERMEFSKDGAWDELIALDRYVVTEHANYVVGDTVVFTADLKKKTKLVGTIKAFLKGMHSGLDNQTIALIVDRFGEEHTLPLELCQRCLETRPAQMWERWAKAGASMETSEEKRLFWENEFRWLTDGFRYSLGGRIMLMLGQEHVTGVKANLTAYNCYVARCPRGFTDPVKQWNDVLDVAFKEASIEKRGGGVGINISLIETVVGAGRNQKDFVFYLDKAHPDYNELMDEIKLGKFEGVTIVTGKLSYMQLASQMDTAVIEVRDSMTDGLFEDMKLMVMAAYSDDKKIVLNFNGLRKRNALVASVNGRSSGAASWMGLFALIARMLQQDTINNVEFAEIFSFITNLIEQGGSRRGALMLICDIRNANVRFFIARKRELGYLQGANISVGIDDAFMALLDVDPDTTSLWNEMIQCAWASAEPGVVWMERYNKESNSHYFNPIVCTNPCGEQGLPEWGVCNLGHFVLSRFYEKGKALCKVNKKSSEFYYPKWSELVHYDVNWDDLARAVRAAVRLQDNIIDYTPYFLDENREVQLNERRIGIGSLALATLMIKLKLRYGSEEGNRFVDTLYKFIAYFQYKSSMDNAAEKGAFPKFDYEQHRKSGFMSRLLQEFPDLDEKLKRDGIRNVTLSTQAPTGSTGTMIDSIPLMQSEFGGASTGIEPYFAFTYWRASRLGMTEQTCHIAQQYMDENALKSTDDLPDYFVTAMELAPEDHVRVQAAVQRWTDSSISKTANCPADYTIEQTDKLYRLSYELGLKGMTIYRDGSRDAQVLSTDKEKAKLEVHLEAERLEAMESAEVAETPVTVTSVETVTVDSFTKRPERLHGITEKIRVPFGDRFIKAYVTINVDDDGHPVEVFVQSNDAQFDMLGATIGRLVTQFLRYGRTRDNLEQVVKHLRKGQTMGTFASRLATMLEHIAYGKIAVGAPSDKPKRPKMVYTECADCHEKAFDKANCICTKCGSSKCN